MRLFRGPVIGVLAVLLLVINILIVPSLVVITAAVGKLVPLKKWQRFWHYIAENILTSLWVDGNSAILRLSSSTPIEIQGNGELHQQGWYCLIANHQSWLDILILQKVFNRKIPILKFFMKQSLLWKLPIAGLACWLLDFPFMRRYSNSYLKKHPEKKGKDREITRKACQKFINQPVAMMSFIEGTRFTIEKKTRQDSPYQYLLRPYSGNLAFVLYALQDCLHDLINITIIYTDGKPDFWRFICGRAGKIIVRYEVFPIPNELRGDYQNDPAFRKQFQTWISDRWSEKDKLLKTIIENN